MEQDPEQTNIKTVSYRKILPKYEVWPATDAIDYIDLQYDSTVYKDSTTEPEDSPNKFNSLPTIKSGRRAKYISALEAISLGKSEAKADLSLVVPEPASPISFEDQSKLSDTTTVVIHESPRGICNDAFEDDEDTADCKKHRGASSPSHSSSVSFSSNDSTVHIPEEVNIDAAIQKKLESEGLSKQQIEGHMKKKWRSEKLYLGGGQSQHSRTFCWWMLSLILLAGAITVAALIGVGVIKLPIKETSLQSDTMIKMDDTRPRLSFTGSQESADDRPRSFIDSKTVSQEEVDHAFTRNEDNGVATEIPSDRTASKESITEKTEETSFTEASTVNSSQPSIATTNIPPTITSTSANSIIEEEGSGEGLETIEIGSGVEITSNDENEDTLGRDNFLLDESLTQPSFDTIENFENLEISDDDGSGELELIITLPDIEGSGSTSNQESFSTGEEVFKALIDFLIPAKDRETLSEGENVAFKELFNIIAS